MQDSQQDPYDEKWFKDVQIDRVSLRFELEKKRLENMNDEDKQIRESIKPKIDEAKQHLEQKNAADFVVWLSETYVPENLRTAITDEAKGN